MSASKLFQPLKVGKIDLKHRVVMAPLTRFRANEQHEPLPMMAEHYGQRASVAGGLLIAEATYIAPEHNGMAHTPGVWSSEQIEGWRSVTSAVHAKGGNIFLQLNALGRTADPKILSKEGDFPFIAPSNIPLASAPDVIPRSMTRTEVQSTVHAFAQAAKNAISAGFDGVELHGANGYLIDQFIQDVSNNRSDDYGGSIANRARFALEVAQAVSDAIGSDRVGIRLNPFGEFQSMKMVNPIPQFSYLIEQLKHLNLAYLHLMQARFDGTSEQESESLKPFLDIWGRSSPVLIANGYDGKSGKHAIDVEYVNNDAAIVYGRHFIANPDLPYRIEHDLELNPYDRDTFYSWMQSKGYTDYPFHPSFRENTYHAPAAEVSQFPSVDEKAVPVVLERAVTLVEVVN